LYGATQSRPAHVWALSLVLLLAPGQPLLAAEADSSYSDTLAAPRSALVRSALVPGWGQYYNGRPFKALFFSALSSASLAAVVIEERQLGQLSDQLDRLQASGGSPNLIADQERRFQNQAGKRNTRLLYFALSVAGAAIDAYVDAHLADFGTTVDLALRPGGVLLRFDASLARR